MAINDLKNKWHDIEWRNTAKTLPARAAGVARSPLWRRRAAWALGVLLLVWALAYAAVPSILKSQLEKIASEKLGRQVTVGAVDFKPWSLELTLRDLAIAKAGAAGAPPASPQEVPQLAVKRIYIDAELESLLRLAPVADAVQIDEPVAFLAHKGEGRYDIDDILERLKAPADQPASDAPRFAVYNIVVSGGRLDFADQSVGKTHELRDLNLSVPFLSNLKSQREIKTSPHLAFKLNGSSFDTAAEGTPFAQTHKTDATLTLRGFDLKPYLAYWPASLPFKLQSAVLHADAKVAFEQAPATQVRISGTVTAEKVRVQAAGQAPVARPDMLAFERLQVTMADVRPLEQFVKLASVELSAPALSVVRDRAGRLNLLPPAAAPAAKSEANTPDTAKPAASARAPASTPWKVQVARAAVRAGSVNWLDETLASPADIRLTGLALNATAIAMPFSAGAPLQFDGSVGLEPPTAPVPPLVKAGAKAGARLAAPQAPAAAALLTFQGSATDQAAQLTARLASWPLGMAAKYVGQFLLPALGGQLDAELGVNWQAASGEKPQVLQLSAPQIALSEVQLAQGKVSLVSVKRVDLAQVDIDLTGQSFKAAKLLLTQPRALVERGSDKRWMYERWMVNSGAARPAPPPTDAATRASAPSWAVAISDVQLEGGAMSFSDKAGAKPVGFEVTAAKAQLGGLLLDDRLASRPQAAKPMPLTASLRLATGRFEPGKVDFNGSLGLAPLQAQGRLLVDRLPVQAFEPYFADILNIELLRADASFKGRVAYRQTPGGPQAQVTGDVSLEELRANTLAPSEDLLAWKALNLRGFHVALEPAKATRVEVKETVLTDFFARVIVMPDGRINLQDLVKSGGPAAAGDTAAAAAAPASAPAAPPKTAVADAKGPPAPAAPQPIVSFGPISLINGKVLFSDRFVKPNYSADLSDLTGKLSAFSSVAPAPAGGAAAAPNMADLELRGRAEGTASLEILGKLNPLAKPLALDIKGKVRDLELPPLSPYSVKYSGYGINRGKLSVDVSYLVQPDGRLTATNKVILNQLSFGEKVPGSTASLPVKLAVALLADRNGVIDIDLPISGSLNDPQFSLGPIIVKVIVNVIVKAITAPFSLLANAFGGGGEELSVVGFAPGSAELRPEAKAGLDKVAKALADRPSLQLTVVGTSSVEAEREGFKRERLDALVRAEKRRITVKEGGTTSAAVSISPAEYPDLLKEVYKRADMPKPRNLIGLAKDLPVPEMEKLLLADIKVNDDAMRELAVQRGVAVKDYLASRELPPERLFLGAAKAVPPEAKWTPRAELNLAMP
ncbi:hypothetical protein involved in outer membrane biogenesis [Polaromonas sp. CF318]|uniref:DUF748 domain-containing protein n=1 Tax=Polaromonas sp. CF318 TaxID=1144318 RepID=UPI0002710926|nr:DUF748 domain-containing protein [Polaromonas sp. CF318]EJL80559.1 hypothetical protein involved in outer membrane biogenesis [Polaromonas sp. CF318]